MRLVEEILDRLGDDVADALDGVEFLNRAIAFHRLGPFGAFVVIARQELGRGLADMADAERVDEAVERDIAAAFDARHEILDYLVFLVVVFLRFFLDGVLAFLGAALVAQGLAMLAQDFAHALCLRRQRKNVGGLLQQALLMEQFDIGATQSLDVEGVAADEML